MLVNTVMPSVTPDTTEKLVIIIMINDYNFFINIVLIGFTYKQLYVLLLVLNRCRITRPKMTKYG